MKSDNILYFIQQSPVLFSTYYLSSSGTNITSALNIGGKAINIFVDYLNSTINKLEFYVIYTYSNFIKLGYFKYGVGTTNTLQSTFDILSIPNNTFVAGNYSFC
jgi:hypothetical protein